MKPKPSALALARRLRRAEARIAALEKQIAAMRLIGAQMSNVCANWCQEGWGMVSDPRQREMLRKLYKEWDQATKEPAGGVL